MAIDKITASGLGDGQVDTADLADGAVTGAKLDSTAVYDADTTSTGQFTLPSGTTAQQPATSYTGAQRYNTDLGVMEYYDGSTWKKVSAQIPVINSVSGNVNDAYSSTMVLTGQNYLTSGATVSFTHSGTAYDVSGVTPDSDTQITVIVPSGLVAAVSSGDTVTITVTNSDSATSASQSKTVISAPTGGAITTSGGYRYHKFTSASTNFQTFETISADYLVVAGGAGGGRGYGGGGGAGGLRSATSQSLTTGTYTALVGAGGGIPADGVGTYGGNGGNSSFNGLVSSGGGGGGYYNDVDGVAGGSGGGGGGNNGGAVTIGGSGTVGQGNDGGTGTGNSPTAWGGAGGGGGAGGVARLAY